jgi:hypothetical protein
MRKVLLLIVLSLFSVEAFSNNPPDNGVKKFRGFYVNLFYPIIDRINKPCPTLTCNDESELFNRTPFSFRMPNIGGGYTIKYRFWFVRTDVSFCYAYKNIDYTYDFDAWNMDDRTEHSRNLFGNAMPSVGSRYYSIDETYKGKINFYYVNTNMALGINVRKGFTIYTGWCTNNLIKYNYEKSLTRHGTNYEVISNNYQNSTFQAVDIGEAEDSFNKKEIAKRINQDLHSDYYLNIGVNRSFSFGKNIFFWECQFDYNILSTKTKTHLITFKLAYVFKSSTDFSSATR